MQILRESGENHAVKNLKDGDNVRKRALMLFCRPKFRIKSAKSCDFFLKTRKTKDLRPENTFIRYLSEIGVINKTALLHISSHSKNPIVRRHVAPVTAHARRMTQKR